MCGTDNSAGYYCGYPTYFPMTNDTLRALVIFANYPNGYWDPYTSNSNLIYMQYWPGTNQQHLQKPTWADSVICPTTNNVWHPSLTGLLAQGSNGKFWLIGDVYPELVVTDSVYSYYSPPNRRIGHAVKEIIDKVSPNVNWADYDKFDPCDINSNGNRREPDGQVDFIFVLFRFNVSEVTDPDFQGKGYIGIADLGGRLQTFGDSSVIVRQGKKISAHWPGSGCIVEMHHKWYLGPAKHEFAFHYAFGFDVPNGLGSHNIQGGGLASAKDREELGWNFGNIYQPVSNTTNINLRDYVTTGDHIKISRNGKTYYIENRRRLNYYSSPMFHGWRWTINEPLMPVQSDSGIYIYNANNYNHCYHAYGKWNYSICQNGRYKVLKPPYILQFIPETVNRYSGLRVMDLAGLPGLDANCNSLFNNCLTPPKLIDKPTYIGAQGDTNTCFDAGYNMVFSPWSNPGIAIGSSSDSLTIELAQRNSDGSIDVNVFFSDMTLSAPSKPQFLRATKQYNSNPQNSFYIRLTWLRNMEPDMSTYGIYKAATNTPGEDGTYEWLSSTSDTTYLDQSILMYDPGTQYTTGCPLQPGCFSYRVTAVDLSEKESCLSDRDSVSGYFDPCISDPEGPDNPNTETDDEGENVFKQNYPNPFNPVTTFEYSIKNNGNVKATIYDVTGKIITVLADEYMTVGKYTLIFNASAYNLSSGVYFCRFESGELVSIRQIILLK